VPSPAVRRQQFTDVVERRRAKRVRRGSDVIVFPERIDIVFPEPY
jgi:hypothetical protein